LIKKSLETDQLHESKTDSNIKKGVTQNSILSPVFSNIYLHELDIFIDSMINEYAKGACYHPNPRCQKIQKEMGKTVKLGEKIKTNKCKKKIQKFSSVDKKDHNYVKISYSRYASDFIIGIGGSLSLARIVLGRIKTFLKGVLYFDLNQKKTKIISFKNKIEFLWAKISSGYSIKKTAKLAQKDRSKRSGVHRTPRIHFHAPIKSIIEKLIQKNYYK